MTAREARAPDEVSPEAKLLRTRSSEAEKELEKGRKKTKKMDDQSTRKGSIAHLMGDTSGVSVDLQRLVISYIPTRPRLMVLSYVCKRWRRLVLESIEMLPRRHSLAHLPADCMLLVRLIGLCPNVRYLSQTVENFPVVPNLPKLERFSMDVVMPSDVEIEWLRQSTCLTSLFSLSRVLPVLYERGITLDSFPHLQTLTLLGRCLPADEWWARLSLPSITHVKCFALSGPEELAFLKPHFSKLRALTLSAWAEPNGLLDLILSNASSFDRLTHLGTLSSSGVSLHLDLATAQKLLRACNSLKSLHLCKDITVEPAALQLLAPYMSFFCARDIEYLPLATPGLSSTLALAYTSTRITDYPHVMPYLSRMQRLELRYVPGLDLSSAVGVTSLLMSLTQPTVMPHEIATKWCIPTLRSLTLLHWAFCDLGYSRIVHPLLRVLFCMRPPGVPFPFPALTDLEVDIADPLHELDRETLCGWNFAEFVALLPRMAASGIHTLCVRNARPEEAQILMQERNKYAWMDINPYPGVG